MVVGENQWLEHHDLEAKHQQQFQEPKKYLHLVIKKHILKMSKKVNYLIQKICFGSYGGCITRMFN